MTLGPVMLNIEGIELTDEDRRRLMHPQTGGIVLFTRNYRDPQQLSELCAEIHALRDPPLVITVDHEGGRVQRFREGFQALAGDGATGRSLRPGPGRGDSAGRDVCLDHGGRVTPLRRGSELCARARYRQIPTAA